MHRASHIRPGLVGLGLALFLASIPSASATTLRRMGLSELVRTNESVVIGHVTDATSYWLGDGTFILTDVAFTADSVLKGSPSQTELTVTIMGGTVGDATALVVAGAELVPGREYLLFLAPSDLPGAEGVTSVRDHCQGAFDVVRAGSGARVVSQATQHPLLSDDLGVSEPPGGQDGLELGHAIGEIRRAARQGRE